MHFFHILILWHQFRTRSSQLNIILEFKKRFKCIKLVFWCNLQFLFFIAYNSFLNWVSILIYSFNQKFILLKSMNSRNSYLVFLFKLKIKSNVTLLMKILINCYWKVLLGIEILLNYWAFLELNSLTRIKKVINQLSFLILMHKKWKSILNKWVLNEVHLKLKLS
jgi:hypothetical protein